MRHLQHEDIFQYGEEDTDEVQCEYEECFMLFTYDVPTERPSADLDEWWQKLAWRMDMARRELLKRNQPVKH